MKPVIKKQYRIWTCPITGMYRIRRINNKGYWEEITSPHTK